MSAARKLLAVALQCVLLSMTIVGNVGACERMGTMPAMDHSMPDSHQHHAPDQQSKEPASPDDCVLMTACSLSAVTVAAVVIEVPPPGVNAAPVSRIVELRSVARAPEPPPPRA